MSRDMVAELTRRRMNAPIVLKKAIGKDNKQGVEVSFTGEYSDHYIKDPDSFIVTASVSSGYGDRRDRKFDTKFFAEREFNKLVRRYNLDIVNL